jgi:serpin B
MKRYLPLFLTALLGVAPIAHAATPVAVDTANRNNGFAATLYAQLDKSGAEKNFFLSPYSISAALGMTAQGARGATADQMNKVLNVGEKFPAGMAEIGQVLTPKDAPFALSVANGLWVDQNFPLLNPFVEACQQNYDANVVAVDFAHDSQGVRKRINTAVAAQTHDKIKDLLPNGSVDARTALVLTNAIYFKGTWQYPFVKQGTTDEPFHLAGGEGVKVPLMKSPRETNFAYAETDDAQLVSLPYKAARPAGNAGGFNGMSPPASLSMIVVLPKKAEGLPAVEKTADAATLGKWVASLRSKPVEVYLPRFTMTSQLELSKELGALGMTDAFTEKADFSGISGSATGKLLISAVFHKAFIDVNEEGTEAAGATGVVMRPTAARVTEPPVEFRADHPFMFLIRENSTGQILFMGRVCDPRG